MRSCSYYQKFGFGAFGIFPVLLKQRVSSEDYGVMGLRYGSSNMSVGATVIPFFVGDELPKSAWLVSKMGRLTAGVQYEPTSKVKNPLEENEIVGITNYIDFGFELQTSIDDEKSSNNIQESTFQVAASWQANKNFLLKGKVGSLSSSIALAFKSWWKPSFTFSISAVRDRTKREMAFGFGVCVDNIREASYQRADPNFVMLTPNKEHLAECVHWEIGKRPVFQSDVNSGNFDGMPKELRPLAKIL